MSVEVPCVYFSDGKCAKFSEPGYVSYCGYSPCGFDVPSNADRIRAMTDDELAEFLTSVHFVDVLWCLRWLKSPVEVDE